MLSFTNLDVVAHNVASKEVTEDGLRLFSAPNIPTGSTAVEGSDKLKPGKLRLPLHGPPEHDRHAGGDVMAEGLTRRQAVAAAGTVAAGAALAPYLRAIPAPAQSAAFTLPLRQPPILRKADIVMPIVQADVPLTRGERTLMWTFGGTFPGPTIRRAAGRTTRVTFEHRLPEAGSLTIHNHGHHNAAIHDGQPMTQLLQPGARREYVYEHVEEGEPLRGGMRWYHDHSHGRTNQNLWRGLLGLFIVVDPLEKQLGLPQGERELVLVLTTRTLDANNQLVDPFIGNADPGADAVGSGTLLLVNGVTRPYQVVEPTTYRLRILNAASFNPYNVGFDDNKAPQILQLGNESGLFPAPAKRDRVLMGPAERCDLFVDFSGHAGKRLVLGSAPQKATAPLASLLAPAVAPAAELVEFRVRKRRKKKTPKPRAAPKKLRELPSWTRSLPRNPDRMFVFGQAINPRASADRVDDQRRALRRRPRRRAARARDDRDLAAGQRLHAEPLHPSARGRLVRDLAQRRDAGGGRGRAQGDVPARSGRDARGRREVHRPPRSVSHPLPHAQPRGPRDDDHVRDRPPRRRRPQRRGAPPPSPRRSCATSACSSRSTR